MGKLFLGAAGIAEVMTRAADLTHAGIETWQKPSTLEHNKNLIAERVGKPLVETVIYSSAALSGLWKGRQALNWDTKLFNSLDLQATSRPITSHVPHFLGGDWPTVNQLRNSKYPALAKIYGEVQGSVVRLEQRKEGVPPALLKGGTGFTVEGGLIATNNHVVRPDTQIFARLSTGELVETKLVARDKFADLALLKPEPGIALPPPLKLGSADSTQLGTALYGVGHPLFVERAVVSTGSACHNTSGIKFVHSKLGVPDETPAAEFYMKKFGHGGDDWVPAPVTPTTTVRIEHLASYLKFAPGSSGSPLLDASGQVVAIHHHSHPGYARGTAVGHLKALLEAVRSEPPAPGQWLNVISHAQPGKPVKLPDSEKQILSTSRIDILSVKKFGHVSVWR